MRHGVKCALVAALAISVSITVLAAGPTTGTPPFRSLGGGPDVINLGNLNVHYSMPVFSRAGRGMVSRTMTWNCNGGVMTQLKDENQQPTNYNYTDPNFWRISSISYPGGGQTSLTYNTVTPLT